MSQMESVEQGNVSNNTNAFEQVSQQLWSPTQSETENSMSNKFSTSESRFDNSADSHLPSITFSGEESEGLQKQDAGAVEGELKDMEKKHGAEQKPLQDGKPKPPLKPTDKDPGKPNKPIPDKPDSMDKPKLPFEPTDKEPGNPLKPQLKPADKPSLAPTEKPKPVIDQEPVGKF